MMTRLYIFAALTVLAFGALIYGPKWFVRNIRDMRDMLEGIN